MLHRCRSRLLLLLLALPAAARAQHVTPPPTGAPGAAGAVAARDTAGILRPGDVIRLRIWREPDLSGEFPVDQSGVAVLPKLGPMRVTNIPAAELTDTLRAAFQRYLRNPSIDVVLLRRITILGAVKNPGLYPVDATVTVGDALALAGGIAPDGEQNKISLIRDGRTLGARLSSHTRMIDSPIRTGDQIYVAQRSWLKRNIGAVAVLLSATVAVARFAMNGR